MYTTPFNIQIMLYDDRDSNSFLDVEQLQELTNNGQENPKSMSFFKFFKYVTNTDRILLGVGTFCAIVAGFILPSISLIMGNVAEAFSGGSSAGTNIVDEMNFIASYVILIATTLFTFSYVFFAFWQHAAENITTDLRKRYLRALMQQEVGFFELNKVEQIPSQMTEIFETV